GGAASPATRSRLLVGEEARAGSGDRERPPARHREAVALLAAVPPDRVQAVVLAEDRPQRHGAAGRGAHRGCSSLSPASATSARYAVMNHQSPSTTGGSVGKRAA